MGKQDRRDGSLALSGQQALHTQQSRHRALLKGGSQCAEREELRASSELLSGVPISLSLSCNSSSSEWNNIDPDEREELQLKMEDGEFW